MIDYFDFIDNKLFAYFSMDSSNPNLQRWENILEGRKTTKNYLRYKNEYSMIGDYIEFNRLFEKAKLSQYLQLDKLISDYEGEYYLLDLKYRHFLTKLNNPSTYVSDTILNNLKDMADVFGDVYNNYLFEWGQEWTRLFQLNNLTTSLVKQRDFYKKYIGKSETRKAVIISDSLRYEIAKEIVDEFNTSQKGEAIIDGVEGFLPSITKFGMAALLPNKAISINDNNDVLVDGLSTKTRLDREYILKQKNFGSRAIDLSNFLSLTTVKRKEEIKNQNVLYFYHNKIDAAGEGHDSTQVLEASKTTIAEILNTIRILRNLSVGEVILTSDHGFVYTRKQLQEHEKKKTSKKGNSMRLE